MSLKVGEYGRTIFLDLGLDVAAASAFSIIFTKPDGAEVTKINTDGVEIGNTDEVDDCGKTLLANTYLKYKIESDLLDVAGTWKLRSDVTLGDKRLIGDLDQFKVSS